MEFIKDVGAYAGFAAVVGLGVLAALYFSQARDVKRLREWAGRAPERSADQPAAAAVVPAQRGAVKPTPGKAPAAGRPVRPGQPAARPGQPAQPGAPPGKAPAPGAPAKPGVPAAQPAATSAAGASAAAATAAGGATTAKPPGPPTGADGEPKAPAPGGDKPPVAPATRPGRAAPAQTRVVPRDAAEQARRRAAQRAAATRTPERRFPLPAIAAVAVIAVVLVVGGITLFGGDDEKKEPASEQTGQQGGNGAGGDNNTPAVDPSQVTVAVLNGTTVEGLARTIGDEIQAAGFQLGNVTNAAEQGERAESAALYAPDHKADARAVARKLKISQIEPIDAESQSLAGDATVVVIVGLDQTQ